MDDPVNKPSHYCVTLGNGVEVECIDVMEALGFECNAYLWNVFSYLWRHEDKNGLEDLKKARFYLDRYINRLEA